MHHLANIYLAGENPDLMTGSFISGFTRSIKDNFYSPEVVHGIHLGWQIRNYWLTQQHVGKSMSRLNTKFYKHSDKIIEIFYDHFLAAGWEEFSMVPFRKYIQDFYQVITACPQLPYKLKKLLPEIISGDWLFRISTIDGVHQYMKHLIRKDTFQSYLEYSLEDLCVNYTAFKEDFNRFFSSVRLEEKHLKLDAYALISR